VSDELRVAVIDDEPLAREGLAELLMAHGGVTIAGTFAGGPSALAGLSELRPDALFVDVQMPGMSGFELVDALDLDPLPAIVFVTAYDEYALRAFEVSAIDYLLKPVSAERLAQTMDRVRLHARGRVDDAYRTRITTMLDTVVPGRATGVGRLIVREVGQVIIVPTREVDWIEGADYYVKLHVRGKVHMLRETLTSLEQRLDPRKFLRVHKSSIVNLTRVRAVEAHLRGEGIAVLNDGTRLKVTRSKRGELERRLEELHDGT
jgi:two-component system, LytTR family, response regulator